MDECNRFVLQVLCIGRESLEYSRQLGNSEAPEPDRPMGENGSPDWCVCNVCVDLANEEENKCCGKRSCVTSCEMFRNVVLDSEVLNIAIRAQCDIRAEVADFEMNSFCKAQGSTLRPIQSHLRLNFTYLQLEKRE